MTPAPSPYEILGVARSASQADVVAAWRSFSKKSHPDRHATRPQAERDLIEENFRKAREAFELLSDPKRRAAYDSPPSIIRPVDLPYSATRNGGRVEVEVPLGGGHHRVVVLDVPRRVRPGYRWTFGDLVVELRQSQIWKRVGWDLQGYLRVTLDQLLTGADVTVDGPRGPVLVTLPERELKPIRIKGHGHQIPGFSAGDLVLELDVAWPEPDARLLAELRRTSVNS